MPGTLILFHSVCSLSVVPPAALEMRSQQWDLCLWLQQCVLSKSSFECKRGMFYSGKWIPTCRPGKEKRHWWQLKPLQCNSNGGIGSNRSSKSPIDTAVKVRGWVKLCTIVVSMTWVRCMSCILPNTGAYRYCDMAVNRENGTIGLKTTLPQPHSHLQFRLQLNIDLTQNILYNRDSKCVVTRILKPVYKWSGSGGSGHSEGETLFV